MRLALVFGGRSSEHEVSVVSARSVRAALDPERYQVVPMAIDHDGRWAEPEQARAVLEGSGDRADEVIPFSGALRLDPRLLSDEIDVAVPILHGPYGEDGTIQGLFATLNLPFVGCDVAASAVCMNKVLTKRLLQQAGIATPQWVEIDSWRWAGERELCQCRCLELGLPVFVKPVTLGSSIGISKVSDSGGLAAAIDLALRYDDWVIVERGIAGRELELAVLGNQEPRASLPGEIVPGHEFYDYEDKYLDDSCTLHAPAQLPAPVVSQAQQLAVKVFTNLGCEGMARVDLFLDATAQQLWVNEVNTIPGFTSISMYAMLWAASGIAYPALLDRLVDLAVERHQRVSRRATSLMARDSA